MSDQPYLLYGAYASYYTAKVRCYLRKKGIPFAERLPSDPTFREVVRPTSGNHRIPQILAPDGEVIQDSVAIVDALEKVFPDVPAHPSTPCQRLFVHLMELLGYTLSLHDALPIYPFHYSRFWTNLPTARR